MLSGSVSPPHGNERTCIGLFAKVFAGRTHRFVDYWQIAQPVDGVDSHTSKDGLEWFLIFPELGQLRPLYKFQVLVWPNKREQT